MPGLTAQAGEGAQAPTVKPAGLANAGLLEPEYIEKDKDRMPSFLAAAIFVTAVTTAHGPAPASAAGLSSAF
ncbi:hypothetical protein LTR91_000738 [Friedmanniomyces endolithicus]|uniref:Uncharacterized protein n=1 Tax=Friedmanniomyces endolithicus TaxID=329885 RepID=A0AAN6L3E0_9PEZI|nr:hypothetical protein LTR91_000738 [Friedmanniomyces endolithicus]